MIDDRFALIRSSVKGDLAGYKGLITKLKPNDIFYVRMALLFAIIHQQSVIINYYLECVGFFAIADAMQVVDNAISHLKLLKNSQPGYFVEFYRYFLGKSDKKLEFLTAENYCALADVVTVENLYLHGDDDSNHPLAYFLLTTDSGKKVLEANNYRVAELIKTSLNHCPAWIKPDISGRIRRFMNSPRNFAQFNLKDQDDYDDPNSVTYNRKLKKSEMLLNREFTNMRNFNSNRLVQKLTSAIATPHIGNVVAVFMEAYHRLLQMRKKAFSDVSTVSTQIVTIISNFLNSGYYSPLANSAAWERFNGIKNLFSGLITLDTRKRGLLQNTIEGKLLPQAKRIRLDPDDYQAVIGVGFEFQAPYTVKNSISEIILPSALQNEELESSEESDSGNESASSYNSDSSYGSESNKKLTITNNHKGDTISPSTRVLERSKRNGL